MRKKKHQKLISNQPMYLQDKKYLVIKKMKIIVGSNFYKSQRLTMIKN